MPGLSIGCPLTRAVPESNVAPHAEQLGGIDILRNQRQRCHQTSKITTWMNGQGECSPARSLSSEVRHPCYELSPANGIGLARSPTVLIVSLMGHFTCDQRCWFRRRPWLVVDKVLRPSYLIYFETTPPGGPSSVGITWRPSVPSRHHLDPVDMPLEAKLRGQRLLPRAPRTTLNGFAPRYPNCGQDAATFETGPRVSRDRCARRSPHNRRHAASDSHSARPGPFLRSVRRSIRTYLADHHPMGRQRDDSP